MLHLDSQFQIFFDRHAHHEPASEEPLQSSDAFARIVAHSIVGQSSANIPSMPWETGPMRSIFMNDDVTQNLTVPIQILPKAFGVCPTNLSGLCPTFCWTPQQAFKSGIEKQVVAVNVLPLRGPSLCGLNLLKSRCPPQFAANCAALDSF